VDAPRERGDARPGNLRIVPRGGLAVNAASPPRGGAASSEDASAEHSKNRPSRGQGAPEPSPPARREDHPGPHPAPPFPGQEGEAVPPRERRPAKARARVSSSAYCRSAPAGSPWANRLTRTPVLANLSTR
jgi:hypothetical protein